MFKLARDFWFAMNIRFGRCAALITIFKSPRRTPSLVIDQTILSRICGSKAEGSSPAINRDAIEISGRDLRERSFRPPARRIDF
jgi:hypothetical protein